MKERPPISRRTLPNLPWSFSPNNPIPTTFVLGVANSIWPIRDPKLPKDWPIAYKYVRWHRLYVARSKENEFKSKRKEFVYLKDTTGYENTIQTFIDDAIESIKQEKQNGKLRSVHSIAIIFDPHGEDSIEIIPVQ